MHNISDISCNMREKNKNYKRIDRQIVEAFVAIACRKPSAEMTVSELCKIANINHTTFYRHYRGLWQVHESILDDIYKRVEILLSSFDFESFVDNPLIFYGSVNKMIEQDLDLYRQICHAIRIDTFLVELHLKLVTGIIDKIGLPEGERKEQMLVRITYIVSGTISIYRRWLCGELNCSLDDIGEEAALNVKARILLEQNMLKNS